MGDDIENTFPKRTKIEEGRLRLKEAYTGIHVYYMNQEPQKGATWLDMSETDLETLLFLKIAKLQKETKKEEQNALYRDIAIYCLMLWSKHQTDETEDPRDMEMI